MYGPSDYDAVAKELIPTPEEVHEARRWTLDRLFETQRLCPADAQAFARATFGGDEDIVLNARDARQQAQIISYWRWALAAREAIHELARLGVVIPTAMPSTPDSPIPVDTTGPQIPLSDSAPFGRPFLFPTVALSSGYRFPSGLSSEGEAAQKRFVDDRLRPWRDDAIAHPRI